MNMQYSSHVLLMLLQYRLKCAANLSQLMQLTGCVQAYCAVTICTAWVLC
jgi:hypothetical protein